MAQGVGQGQGKGGGRRAHVRLWPKSDRAEPNRAGVGVAVGAGEQSYSLMEVQGSGRGKGQWVKGCGVRSAGCGEVIDSCVVLD